MIPIKAINTILIHENPVNIIKVHLNNFRIYDSNQETGTNIAKTRLTLRNGTASRDVNNELELLLSNLAISYSKTEVITALRSVKMYNYCKKYLKVS